MHHHQIVYTYGLTDSDLKELSAVEGIDVVEGVRQSMQTTHINERMYTFKVQEIPTKINVPKVVEGVMPSKTGEIALLAYPAKKFGLNVGDTIKFDHDTNTGMKFLATDAYKVTALVSTAEYLSTSAKSYGLTNSGSGMVEMPAWVVGSDFKASAFQDGYPIVNVRSSALEGLHTYSNEYATASDEVKSRIEEVGAPLGNKRFSALHSDGEKALRDAKAQIVDAEAQIADGEQQLEQAKRDIENGEQQIIDGQAQLDNGYAQIAAGEAQLAAGRAQYEQETADARAKLDEARAKLDAAQAQYNDALRALTAARELNTVLDECVMLTNALDNAEAASDSAMSAKDQADAQYSAGTMTPEQYWAAVSPAFSQLIDAYGQVVSNAASVVSGISSAAANYPDAEISAEIIVPAPLPDMPDAPTKDTMVQVQLALESIVLQARGGIDGMDSASVSCMGRTESVRSVSELSGTVTKMIADGETELAKSKAELDEGERQYREGEAEYDRRVSDALAELEAAENQLANARWQAAQGEIDLANARAALEDGKRQYEEKTAELEAAKKALAEKKLEYEKAEREFNAMKDVKWTVTPRLLNGGAATVTMFSGVTSRLSFSMALLFVIVGLLVSYSAISRIVHEQTILIGTKKALGLRSREIKLSFLIYTTLAVLGGAIVGLLAAVFIVEGIIGKALAGQFTMGTYPAYSDISLALIVTAAELVLVVASAWFACRSILREQAVELLKGEQISTGKTHFYEKWKLWEKLPLFTQTIVNNCVNDKRRVFSTVVGVAGCTALVVTALTLNNDVIDSYSFHFRDIYSYDSIVYVDPEKDGAIGEATKVLENEGLSSVPALSTTYIIELSDKTSSTVNAIVPKDMQDLEPFYHFMPVQNSRGAPANDTVWLSEAFATHEGYKVGGTITLQDFAGNAHDYTIVGFYTFYLTCFELVMGIDVYESSIGTDWAANSLLVNTAGADSDALSARLNSVDGFESLVDDYSYQGESFDAFARVSSTVVAVYLVLALLMAIVVLLNLNVMFIEEKKRELIVLMINGYSVKQAKRYVFNDTIVLTVLGIICGLILGGIMGSITVSSVEPYMASLFKGINWSAIGIGALVSAVLSLAMGMIALRRVSRFNLTDINK